jgi:hypothetical protein
MPMGIVAAVSGYGDRGVDRGSRHRLFRPAGRSLSRTVGSVGGAVEGLPCGATGAAREVELIMIEDVDHSFIGVRALRATIDFFDRVLATSNAP